MSRGRGYSRGSSYRGSSSRGHSSWGGGRGSYSPRGGSSSRFSSSFDSRSRYSSSSSDRFSSRGHSDDFRKPYRSESSYNRDSSHGHRSPDRKRIRTEAPSSRHESSFGGYGSSSSRYDSGNITDRRSFSSDRHVSGGGGGGGIGGGNSSYRRDEFRRPPPPPPPPTSSHGSIYRGRLSSRGSRRGLKLRERPPTATSRRRLVDSSYAIRKRVLTTRPSDYARRLKISRMRSAIARRVPKKSSSDKDESEEDKETGKSTVKEETTEKIEQIKEEKENETKKESKEPEKVEKSDKDDDKSPKKTYIKLVCPHCNLKALTFRKYDIHLSSKLHLMAMRKIALKQKSILAQMRMAQRNTQNELEKNSTDLTPRTNFCPLCKLNYKQRKAIHQRSEAHKNMKKFLMPYCKVCDVTFKSPMIYENHCCSIEHIKRKQRVENGNSEGSGEEDNLENFTTIDSVGDGDVSEGEEKKDENTEPINVGIEKVRKVEAYYCDLCKMYLSRGDSTEMPKIISRHCKQRLHMQRYVRYKEDKDLEKKAEKLQRKETAEKELTIKSEDTTVDNSHKESNEVKTVENDKAVDEEEARDDKLWADVDKDLGDILAEAESGNKSSDEDDDSHVNGERYDRFKLSEKNEDKLNEEGDGTEANSKENEIKLDIKEEK